MTDEEAELAAVACNIASTIVEASKELVKSGGGSVVVVVEFPFGNGYALGIGGNKVDDAPRMLATALAEIPGGPEYVANRAAQQRHLDEAARATKQ